MFAFCTVLCRVADPHWFNADPDPAFFPIADPDPVPNPGFWWPKVVKNLQLKFFLSIFWIINCNLLILRPPYGRTSYRRSLQPSKENIQHFKTWKFFAFFYICGSFLSSWIRIRNQQLKLMGIHPDPFGIQNPATLLACEKYLFMHLWFIQPHA